MSASRQEQQIYDPHSNEPFDDNTSDLMRDVLIFAMGMAKSQTELREFYEDPMNINHFRRVNEADKMALRKEWKRLMLELKPEDK